MLNENLMDSKDIIIAKLKLAIKEFQEYDIERKKYYSNALVELGKLKDEIEELRGINKYSKSYIAMKDENRRLKASLARKGIKELTDFYDVKNVELIIQNQTLKGENRKLRARNSELIKNNKMLINKLNKYEQLLNYMVFLKMKVSLQILLALVGPTVYIVQFAMKLMWHGLEKVRYIPT